MLLIDGVRYELWTPSNEDEFEREVGKHAEEIFGKDAKYFDLKHKLASRSGTGSIPDGYVITLGNKPEVQIIEFELATHTQQHIVNQVVNIINGIEHATTQQKICNAIEDGINEDDIFALKIAKAIKPVAIHRFLSDSFSNTLPIINIIIDKSWPALEEAISKITPPPKVVEFQTFTREEVGLAVHAHLFEPLHSALPPSTPKPIPTPDEKQKIKPPRVKTVSFEELIGHGLLSDRQVLYFYNTRLFTDERAQVIAPSNELKYEGDGRNYSKSELARILLIKHGFIHDKQQVRGPIYWKTQEGRLLKDLEDRVRSLRGGK